MKSFRSVYALPNPLLSQEQCERFYHQDLEAMDDFELFRERRRVEDAIAYWPHRDQNGLTWLLERLAALRQEYAVRRKTVAP
jgi:hypothetical protein